MSFKDHFSSKAEAYAKARPTYPPELFSVLSGLARRHDLVWDCGAGNGQASVQLAGYFSRVVATEPSSAQIASATQHPRVAYVQSAEEAAILAENSVDLITAAQAAHWFDRVKFYKAVERVARDEAVIALWTYSLCHITAPVDEILLRFYTETVGSYWPPERRHTENGYQDFEFPYKELEFPTVAMQHDWTLGELAQYIRTWSAVTRYSQEHRRDPVDDFEHNVKDAWGDPATAQRIVWPLSGRLGRFRRPRSA